MRESIAEQVVDLLNERDQLMYEIRKLRQHNAQLAAKLRGKEVES